MRRDADYNPDASYVRYDVLLQLIDGAERADVVDKRAFAVYVMFRSRVE